MDTSPLLSISFHLGKIDFFGYTEYVILYVVGLLFLARSGQLIQIPGPGVHPLYSVKNGILLLLDTSMFQSLTFIDEK